MNGIKYMIEFIIILSAVVLIFSIMAYFYFQRELEILRLQEKLNARKQEFSEHTLRMVHELYEAKLKQEEYQNELREANRIIDWTTTTQVEDKTKGSEK